MFFVASKTLGSLTDPVSWLVLLVLGQLCAIAFRRRRVAAWLLGGQCLILLAFAVTPLANWLAYPLEARFPMPPTLPDDVAGIIVLGGTERVEQAARWEQPALNDPMPIAVLVDLSRRYPKALLVFSGGWHSSQHPKVSEASVVADFLTMIGGPGDRLITEEKSRNTYENAVLSRAQIYPQPGQNWVLVCQAIGMPRAVGVFRQAGWPVIAYPAGYLGTGWGHFGLAPSLLGSFDLAAIALHEWAGLIVYRVMGYSSALLPR